MTTQENSKENLESALDQPDTIENENQSEDLLSQLNTLQLKHQEMSEAYLRAKADVENIRRRSEEEVTKARKFAVEGFAQALLPVKDSLEAALNTPNQSFENLNEGVQTTLKQLTAVFERNKVEEVSPTKGDKFDPNVHDAISALPSADQEPNTIIEALQKGYTIAGRTIRPAMVIVASKQ